MYHSNSDSSEAFNQLLLQIPRKNNNTSLTGRSKDYDSTNLSLPVFHFLIRNPCKDIIRIGANAEEYYHVELICDEDNGTEFGIQAYCDEAKELYKEINGFTVTAPTTLLENDSKYQEHDQEKVKLKLVKEAINFITDSCFQSGCVLTFKKLTNVCVYKRKI
jgi:hypothetical protein